ncbi:tetratricopeptide repeat protein [Cupriavidus gilardii]|uniref:tetratricopeptide repeat protein n=1 Tax=Cupriavidus gilardii TaxID=82541 RepID=UPI0015741993|nr:tetratricopeptide repeat protein [Cupriavidus gilardii]NSX03261.1 sel1 repeat family protein [Cupriavidus gilardii]
MRSISTADSLATGKPFAWRRLHPMPAIATAAVLLAAACVGGAAVWRHQLAHQDQARRTQLVQWQTLATAAGDPAALAALHAAAERGEVAAQTALGETLWSRPDAAQREQARAWLHRAAGKGDARAHFVLGKAAFLGSTGEIGRAHLARAAVLEKPDYAAAWRHLPVAAQAGHVGAAYYLGLLHRGGYGAEPNPVEAARWFTVAAEGGVPQAMFMLANAYREGSGVARDEAKAVAWYEAAAEREHPESIQALAMAYRDGELGLDRDERNFRFHLVETAHALKHPALKP